MRWHLHPGPDEPHPTGGLAGNYQTYQTTWVDMASLGPVLDQALGLAGIPPVPAAD